MLLFLCVVVKGEFVKLPHGIYIEDFGNVRVIESKWTLLVAIQDAGPGLRLKDEFWRLNNLVASSNISEDTFKTRLVILKRQIFSLVTGNRNIRSPWIGIGGKILSQIFGLVDSDQMEKYQAFVERNSKNIQSLYHDRDLMLSLYNKTTTEVSRNQRLIKGINTYLQYFKDTVAADRIRLHLDLLFSTFESLVNEFVSRKQHFEMQRRHLERGQLTETILPVERLTSILDNIDTQRFIAIKPIVWYYENCHIDSLKFSSKNLLYRVVLPVVDIDEWRRYQIRVWPFPKGSRFYTVDIKRPMIAIYPSTGELIHPMMISDVAGRSVIYNSDSYLCERALISDNVGIGKCHIHEVDVKETTVYYLDDNELILVTLGEQYERQCGTDLKKTNYLEQGTYHVQLNPDCSYQFQTFLLKTISVNFRNVTVRPLNLPNISIDSFIYPTLKSKNMENLDYIAPFDVTKYNFSKPVVIDQHSRGISYANSTLTVIFIATLIFVGACFVKRNKTCSNCIKVKPNDTPRQTESATIPAPLVVRYVPETEEIITES